MTASSRRPTRIERAWQRAPLLLYRLGLGPLLGRRLRLTHTGRRTGRRHHTILEVMEHQSGSGEYFVGAMWGPDSDWLQNVQAEGAVEVLIGRRTFSASARILNPPEADAVLERYRQRRPRWSALAERVIGHPLTAEAVPVVAFRPNGAKQ